MTTDIRISYFPSEQERSPRSLTVTWDQLTSQLTTPRIAECTPDTCPGSSCTHKLGPAWSPAVYPPGLTRGKKNVSAVSLLVVDLDHMTDDQVTECARKLEARGIGYIAHASHSDRDGDRCLRLVMTLDTPVSGADWPRFWPTAVADLELPADTQTCDASRLYFLPSRPRGSDFVHDVTFGGPVPVAPIMAKAPALVTEAPPALPGAVAVAGREDMHAAALEIAAAFPPKGTRHRTFLALAGALASHGWDEDAITELTTMVARLIPGTDEKAIADRPAMARDSVDKIRRGEPVTSWGTVAAHLTRPDAVGAVRDRLGMRAAGDVPPDALLAGMAAPPAGPSNEPAADPSGYPSLDALKVLDVPRAPVVPEVTAEPGTFLYELQRARADIAKVLGSGEVGTGDERPLFFAARDLFTMEFPPTPWLIQGLAPVGGVAGILAEPKSTKSWLALELAASVACGVDALGKFKVPRAVPAAYFFAEDMGPAIRNRLRAFAAGRGMRPEDLSANLHVQPRGRHLDLTKDEDVARVIASCRMIGNIGLLVLDPLRDIHTGKENESDDMSLVFSRLKLIGTLLGCTVLVVHHSKRHNDKNGPQNDNRPGSDARGSSSIEGSLDAIISLRDLCGNGETVFTNTVVTQIKNAKSAGKFQLTLTIRDDKDGTAQHAAWSHGEQITPEIAASFDELVLQCLEHMATAEIKKERAQTNELIRKAVRSKNTMVSAAMLEAERAGFALGHRVGNRRVGWLLTDAGRHYVRKATETPSSATTPAPAAQSADLRLMSGFELAPQT